MMVKASLPVPNLNLVAPLAHKATARHTTDTSACGQHRSGAVSTLIGHGLRDSDVDSATHHRPLPVLRGTRTSTTATRTTTTSTTSCVFGPSADSDLFAKLVAAYMDCRHTKRNTASALAFEADLESNLCSLHEELESGSYTPGRSICFVITKPKPREVWAADFRDRIVHHLLYNHISPRFHDRFVANSCACIPGRGTLYAAQRLEHSVRSVTQNWSLPASYLKCDLANFFVAINKHVLRDQLAQHIAEPWWLWLTDAVLFHDPRSNFELRGNPALLQKVPAHKRLLNAPADTGLPIGNLSSQFFANVHLDALDQFCKHQLQARHYVRYVDDFVLLHPSAQHLHQCLKRIEEFLPDRLGAHLNPSKTILQPVDRGVDFVGHVIKPWRRTTRPRTLETALQRIETMPATDIHAAGNSYLGLVRQATHSHKERAQLCRALMKHGHAVEGRNLTKIFRKGASE